MQRRASWAQGVSFITRVQRFGKRHEEDPGPPAIAQFPTDMGFQAAKLRASTNSSFRKGPERFPKPKPRMVKLEAKDLFELGSPLPHRETVTRPQRPRYTHIFANNEERFKEKQRPTPGYSRNILFRLLSVWIPRPGYYQLAPMWISSKGAMPMAPSTSVVSRKKPDPPLPGPGDYDLNSARGSRSSQTNQRNFMGSTAPRFETIDKDNGVSPPPGHYNISGSLLKPSFNILLS